MSKKSCKRTHNYNGTLSKTKLRIHRSCADSERNSFVRTSEEPIQRPITMNTEGKLLTSADRHTRRLVLCARRAVHGYNK